MLQNVWRNSDNFGTLGIRGSNLSSGENRKVRTNLPLSYFVTCTGHKFSIAHLLLSHRGYLTFSIQTEVNFLGGRSLVVTP